MIYISMQGGRLLSAKCGSCCYNAIGFDSSIQRVNFWPIQVWNHVWVFVMLFFFKSFYVMLLHLIFSFPSWIPWGQAMVQV